MGVLQSKMHPATALCLLDLFLHLLLLGYRSVLLPHLTVTMGAEKTSAIVD